MPATLLLAINSWGIVGIIFGVAALILAGLYFFGKKMQKKQNEAQEQIEASKQVASILVIDKKKLKPKESGLPEAALGQLPWYAKNQKLPIVKAKIGPQIMSLMCDADVFEIIPVKKECKVALSGIYIAELKSVRGGKVPEKPAKVGVLKRIGNSINAKLKKEEPAKGKKK
ncbi:MAG: hypothetical protein IJL47_07075 [Lachnospiraceae bacterium]|nr:hypothetical protein [Lachnospiraceae bacterium]